MKTVTVELKHERALGLLKELEQIDILKIVDDLGKIGSDHKKLSEKLKGSITKDRARELNEGLNKMRNEWEERNI
ncbi:MAG: hypothetical protein K9I94_14905 [Bacteroidales bacterium]|nr:hypothetical protein [Bacteroidales bacterium]